ncbi:hypothetical protein CYLTODRAFT_459923 [Cylindrobasidium torrendii FP15055 ss-10]|uniref:Uncharacterized protein n=1 Tax=Cylindrobasidium torrendii FP15055 ss-10 TaxID=1314674 RepID=A0A0D7ATM7_9AGAR|nr:hypothetical protein CYLTODRAFT_459923 [Cylindrobasidium torrendii FP15055 ss-10]
MLSTKPWSTTDKHGKNVVWADSGDVFLGCVCGSAAASYLSKPVLQEQESRLLTSVLGSLLEFNDRVGPVSVGEDAFNYLDFATTLGTPGPVPNAPFDLYLATNKPRPPTSSSASHTTSPIRPGASVTGSSHPVSRAFRLGIPVYQAPPTGFHASVDEFENFLKNPSILERHVGNISPHALVLVLYTAGTNGLKSSSYSPAVSIIPHCVILLGDMRSNTHGTQAATDINTASNSTRKSDLDHSARPSSAKLRKSGAGAANPVNNAKRKATQDIDEATPKKVAKRRSSTAATSASKRATRSSTKVAPSSST